MLFGGREVFWLVCACLVFICLGFCVCLFGGRLVCLGFGFVLRQLARKVVTFQEIEGSNTVRRTESKGILFSKARGENTGEQKLQDALVTEG